MRTTKRTRALRASLLGAVLAAVTAGLLPGCIIAARPAYVVDISPPPPRHVHVVARPGHVWVDGRWAYVSGGWQWYDGYYVAERPGYVYVGGRWDHHGGRYHWREGAWRPRGRSGGQGVEVRDHRQGNSGNHVKSKPASKGKPHVKVRDHRK